MVVATGALIATGRHRTVDTVLDTMPVPAPATVPANSNAAVPVVPVAPIPQPSHVDSQPSNQPPSAPSYVDDAPIGTATTPEPVREAVKTEVPTPADVAARITP